MGNKLAGYRKMIGLTQGELAQKLGISITNYNHKELGKLKFNIVEMQKITQLVKEKMPEVTMDAIFFDYKVN